MFKSNSLYKGFYYISGIGIWVGEFTEEDVKNKLHTKCINAIKEATGLKDINSTYAFDDNDKPVLRVWVCKEQDKGKKWR